MRGSAMKRMLAIGLACAAGLAAGLEAKPQNPMEKHSVTMSANDIHEECFHLAAGDSVDYRYKTTAAVMFNIHYHTDSDIFTPVKKQGVISATGKYLAKEDHDYC